MYVIREVLNCKPGKVREMVEKFRYISTVMRETGHEPLRVLTDVAGEPFWTIAAEATVEAQRGPQLHETPAVRQASPGAEAPVAAPESPAPETEEEAAPVVDEAPAAETDQDDAVEAGPADEDERPGPS